jgi:pSer/pThr/pTyr-binding forkhead associated (FHA) protein
MTIKNWMLGRMNQVFTRDDLAPRQAATHTVGVVANGPLEPTSGRSRHGGGTAGLEHLGAYRPLIAAIREELERFVASDLRLHLAIAEHDRYVLTAIAIDSVGPDDTGELLRRFRREFAPEQVKHFLAKEIIARLPNASAIDLTQFAGLDAGPDPGPASGEEAAYADLLAELRSDEPAIEKPFEVRLVGRWSDIERTVAPARGAKAPVASPVTPLAGREVALAVEDADGKRRAVLSGVVPGRRYVVGKDTDCSIVVTGLYASRRHCELWFERDTWWVTDCGSTNGIRVEPAAGGAGGRSAMTTSVGGDGKALAVTPGACIVLSASAQGSPGHYPRLVLEAPEQAAAKAPATPITPIVTSAPANGLALTVRMASGAQRVDLPRDALFTIGRSRTQNLVIEWTHEGVSGHHVDLLEPDAAGVRVVVHGDNGVTVDGNPHPKGADFRWQIGQTMRLGRAVHDEPECALILSRLS